MHVTMYVDGGNLGSNPSKGVYWSVGREYEDGRIELLTARGTDMSMSTNNHAEYLALTDALKHAVRIPGIEKLTVFSDSQLIVNQFNKRWKIGDATLRTMCAHAQQSAEYITSAGCEVEVLWVRREENVKRLGH